MKKGFTLVELLGTIALISIIFVVTVPSINKNIRNSKEKSLKIQTNLILKAASDWALQNEKELDPFYLNPTLVSLETLKENGNLKNAKIKNPVTKEEMDGCVVISYSDTEKGYTYEYKEKSCEDLKTSYPKIVSAYSTITSSTNSVASGSGLYELDNEFVYRGNNVNNYIKIKDDMYRIISIDKDTKTLKVIKTSGDTKNWEEKTDATDLSFRVASINANLNSTFYETLDENVKNIIENNSKWYIGPVNGDDMSVDSLKSTEQSSVYNANIGLLSMYEYARASLSDNCSSSYLNDGCRYDNYLNFDSNYWLINNYEDKVWYVNSDGNIKSSTSPKSSLYKVYPVFSLKINTVIKSGNGTSSNPYIVKISD